MTTAHQQRTPPSAGELFSAERPETRRASQVHFDGASFWRRLGNPRFVLAPMVEQSELAFRCVALPNPVTPFPKEEEGEEASLCAAPQEERSGRLWVCVFADFCVSGMELNFLIRR